MAPRNFDLLEFPAASCTGIEEIERRIDFSIALPKLKAKVKEMPRPYQEAYLLMFEKGAIPNERKLAKVLRVTRWQVRRIKIFFKDFFSRH
jgi:hypothetical protein